MKHSFFAFAWQAPLLAALLAVSGPWAGAQALFQEGFNYTSGTELGNNGSWGGGTGGSLPVGSGNLTYSGLADQGGNDLLVTTGAATQNTNIFTTSAISSGTIYTSFLIDCTAQPTTTLLNFFELESAVSKVGAKPNATTLGIIPEASGSGWVLGINSQSIGNNTIHYEPTVLSLNQTYLIVAEYNFSSFTGSLFIDPVPGGTQPATPDVSFTGTTAGLGIQNVGIVGGGPQTGDYILDNITVGQTWSDVTPTSAPEPTTLALSALGLVALGVHYRRNQRQP